jgi:predicted NAD/FAD-dependent oxidoreductase
MSSILVIGAGIAGLTAARELRDAKHQVLVIEQEASVGGRLATRRFGDAAFDYGAQFFTARSRDFKVAIADWEMHRVVRRWFDGYPSPASENPHDVYTRFCGEGGMGTFAENLARPLEIHLSQTVTTLNFHRGRWTARTQAGAEYCADELLLTAPLPQALALFDTSHEALPTAVREQLEQVSYEPCFTVLALLRGASRIPSPGALYLDAPPLSFIADNHYKGVAARTGAVTIHSTAEFARAWFDEDHAAVGRHLIAAASEYLGEGVEQFHVGRWCCARAQNTLNCGALRVPDLHLSFAGDGLCAPRIEGAFLSGLQAARELKK